MHLQKVRMPPSVHSSPEIKDKVSRREAFQLSLVGNNSPQVSPVRKLAMGGGENTLPPPPSPDVRKTLDMNENTYPSPNVQRILDMKCENTPPPSPSPNGIATVKHASPTKGLVVVSTNSGSFSPVNVVIADKKDGAAGPVAKKLFRVMGPKGTSKDMRGLQTNCTKHTIMPWKDWLKSRDAHAHSGSASMDFVETMGVTTIQDGGNAGLWIFEMTMEYVTPVLEFLSSNPDKMNEIAQMYCLTLLKINNALFKDGVVLEDPHPGNCGIRFLPDETYKLVFFDLQFSPIEKGMNIPSEYVFETISDLTDKDRKTLKKRQAFLLMVESIRLYDPARPRKEHLQEIARDQKIGCMSLAEVNRALDAFLL